MVSPLCLHQAAFFVNTVSDVQVVFDFHGLPLKPQDSSFLRGFEQIVFDEVLQYVAFPRNVRISRDSRNAVVPNDDSDMGRRDLGFFFDWLRQQKNVTHIINLHVDDEPCHSDEAIVSCLRGITVDHIDWQKFDMDPQTFSKMENASSVRELSLQWSGRNAVLRAWSEPEGLPMLKGLRKINLHIPSIDQVSWIGHGSLLNIYGARLTIKDDRLSRMGSHEFA